MAMYMLNQKQEHGTAWSYITVEGLKQEVHQKQEVLAWHACSISCCSVLVATMCRYGKAAVAKLTDFLWPFDSFCATFLARLEAAEQEEIKSRTL